MSNFPLVTILLCFCLDNGKAFGSTVNISIASSSVAPPNTTYTRRLTTTATCREQIVSNEWRKEEFPNPQTDVARCGRNCQKSWICDPNKVITDTFSANKIDATLTRIRRNGVCGCLNCTGIGYKMSVALVNKIKFEGWESVSTNDKKTRAQEFASFLRAQSWHPNGTCADDIVIFVSRGDRQVQTAVGPAATAVLSSDCIEYVYKKVKSDLSSGHFGKAVDEMTNLYEQAILTGNCGNNSSVALIIGILGACVGGFAALFAAIILCKAGGRCENCQTTYYDGHHYHGYHFNNHHHRGRFGGGGCGGGGGGGFSSFGAGDGGGGGGGGF